MEAFTLFTIHGVTDTVRRELEEAFINVRFTIKRMGYSQVQVLLPMECRRLNADDFVH